MDFGDLFFEVAVDLQQILAAIHIDIEEAQSKRKALPAGGAQAFRPRHVRKSERVIRIFSRVQAAGLIGKIGHRDGQTGITSGLGHIDPHCTGGCPQAVKRHPRGSANFNKGPLLVVEHEILHGVVGHHDIQPTVTIKIADGQRQRFSKRQVCGRVDHFDAPLRRDVTKDTFAIVLKQAAMGTLVVGWGSVRAVGAVQRESKFQIDASAPLDIPADEDIQISIAVVIEEA